MFYTCTQPKSILGTEIAKPKRKNRIYPKATDNNHLHTMLPKQKKYCLHHSPLSKAHHILSMPPFCFQQNNALILLNCSLEHQQRLQLYTYRNKILINNLFFILVIYYV
jgi:hypothetical protein